MKRLLKCLSSLLVGAACAFAQAATLRIASGFDPQTMDPHALALLYQSRIYTQVYDSLVNRDEQFRLEPSLALSWQATGPTAWRFKLRPGVTLPRRHAVHGRRRGVLDRTRARPDVAARLPVEGRDRAKKVDDLTLEVQLATPDAVLPEKFVGLAIMSKAWCVKHGVEKAQDFNGKQETFAVRNANGTGPFRLERYEPDVSTVLKAHAGWWGRRWPMPTSATATSTR